MSIYITDPNQPAKACIFWFHGLGADASDMQGLVEQLPLTIPCRHVFMDAPLRAVTINNGMTMRAWYDITGFTAESREDEKGVAESRKLIQTAISDQLDQGFRSEQLFLAGFSQGGAMALQAALHHSEKLGGVIALSAYLPLSTQAKTTLPKETPFFIAGGSLDPVVLPTWTLHAKVWLEEKGYQHITWNQYPMEHSICYPEIQDLNRWLQTQIQG